jgi:CubicO group peptidase (beta-lactamase class C family)
VSAAISSGAMPGAAWWVADDGEVVCRGAAGHAAIEPHVELASSSTPFDLASLTKPLATALIALLLEADGRIELDGALGSIFPALRTTPFGGATLRDAAMHRARFPAWKPLYLSGNTDEAYVRAIAASEPGPAGETVYSDLGYILLGLALQCASGRPLDALFDERVARPLGLASCGFASRSRRFDRAAATERGNGYERRLAGDSAAGFRFRDEVIRGEVHDGNAWALGGVAGHAGLFGTAEDVAAIAGAILRPESLGVGPEALRPMLTRATPQPQARTFGFLLASDAESVRGILPDTCAGHFGFTGTSVWIDPARRRVYVLLTNRVHPVVPAAEFTATRRAFHAAAEAA